MELKINNDVLEVWETGGKYNKLILNSEDIYKTKRSDRFYVYDYLLSLSLKGDLVLKTISDIHKSLGRFMRFKDIPKRIEFGNYKVDVSLRHLKSTIQDYISDFNLDLCPNFQRGHVWSNEQRIRFVEFMLEGGRTSPILLNHTNWRNLKTKLDDRFVVVDGLQRLTSLLMFLDDKISVYDNYVYSEFDNVKFNIQIYINDLKTEKEVLQWYLQLNEGGTPHTKDEIDKVKNMINELGDDLND